MRSVHKKNGFVVLLRRYGFTPKRLADVLCVSRGVVSHWALGKRRPSYEHIKSIASALSCAEDEVARCFRKDGVE